MYTYVQMFRAIRGIDCAKELKAFGEYSFADFPV